MTSKLVLLVALAALATSSYAYNESERRQISHQIRVCLRDLPAVGGGSFPVRVDLDCDNQADRQLNRGTTKEKLTPSIIKCVKSWNVASSSEITEIQDCLTDRLSQKLDQDIPYSRAQNKEILNRIEKCLQLVPTYSSGRQPKEVCLERATSSLKDGTWKENLEDQTVRCLQNAEFKVSADVVASAKQCLRTELDARV